MVLIFEILRSGKVSLMFLNAAMIVHSKVVAAHGAPNRRVTGATSAAAAHITGLEKP